jgi:Tfp pilus assembly protein PilW
MVTLSLLVLTVIMTLFMFGLRSFVGLGNYATLSGQSRLALDLMARQMREATQVLAVNTNLPVRSITLTNAFVGSTIVYRWDSTTGILTTDVTGQTTRTNLTGCDDWEFSFYQRTPTNNWTFYPTDDLTLCKLINMSWKCSRTVLGQKLNTEDMMTAQVVLRNKL